MKNDQFTKEIHGIRYYTGAHPIIRKQNKISHRPTEFGHKIWATTKEVINFLSANDFKLTNKNILEIGCGWGLLSLYLVKAHNCKVMATDGDANVIATINSHAQLNKVDLNVAVKRFSQIKDQELKSMDALFGVEVCYCSEAAADVIKLIRRSFQSQLKQIFIADPGRPDFLELLCNSNHLGYKKNIYDLPGTVNGKTTKLLHLSV